MLRITCSPCSQILRPGRLRNTGEHLHERGLTRSVLTAETQDFTGAKVEVHVDSALRAGERLRDPLALVSFVTSPLGTSNFSVSELALVFVNANGNVTEGTSPQE